jgi:purine-binding chemotaxis protein CheW
MNFLSQRENEHELELEQERYIEFGLGDTQYAISIARIHEIIRIQSITEYPNERIFVKGVINLRGKIIPVVCLRTKLQMEDKPYDKSTRIIVLQEEQESFGLLVDRVNRVTSFDELQPPPNFMGMAAAGLIDAIGTTDERLVHILNTSRILRDA